MTMPAIISRRGPNPIDDPAGAESEQRATTELADRVARRHIARDQAKLAHLLKRSNSGNPVQREARDREQGGERRRVT